MIVGTAGHIDHGKSALVEALTGVHPDRLEEERRRGITLDLGFGHWQEDGQVIGVVDVPGHERFIRTMLAGAGGIDVMLLVVAADAGVQPQTVEHFGICRLLGIEQGVVAITKCDLADAAQIERVCRQIRELTAATALAEAAVVQVSAATGAGIEALRRALAQAGRRAGPRDPEAPFRLPLDRAFLMKGFGAVVTGTLDQGRLRVGAEAELAPAGKRVRIRGLHVHGQPVLEAMAGQRVAANLVGVELAELHRGLELVEPGVFASSRLFDVELHWLNGVEVLPHRARCRVHLHAAEAVATLIWLESPHWAQLRLEQPMVAAYGDRCIVRRLSPAATLAGGLVVDAEPRLYRRSEYASAAQFNAALGAAPDLAARLRLWLERAGTQGHPIAALGRKAGRPAAAIQALVRAMGCVVSGTPPAALAAAALAPLERDLTAALAVFHRREPMAEGAALEELALPPALLPWFAVAAERLTAAAQLQAMGGGRYRLAGAAPARSAGQLQMRAGIEDYFRAQGWTAPALPQVLTQFRHPDARALVADLAKARTLIECQPGWFLHVSALDRLRVLLAGKKRQQADFSVAEFKAWTGLSRKWAVPLLEYCDRTRLTRRAGERRLLL
ncbi:MAG: selenocysteine-specific translation elongation factor [Terriglobales bacterium]